MLKEQFLNKISYINSIAVEYGFRNGMELANYAYTHRELSFLEKDELVRFIQMRNMISHGGFDRINVFDDDIKKLDKYILIINKILNIKEDSNASTSNKASDVIRDILKKNNKITVTSFNGRAYDVYLVGDNSFSSTKALRDVKIEFDIFDVVVDILKKEGGKARKGNCRGYNKLGDEKCNEHTIAGAIGYNYFMKKDGESVFDTIHIVTALLEYAGICENKRGYLVLK